MHIFFFLHFVIVVLHCVFRAYMSTLFSLCSVEWSMHAWRKKGFKFPRMAASLRLQLKILLDFVYDLVLFYILYFASPRPGDSQDCCGVSSCRFWDHFFGNRLLERKKKVYFHLLLDQLSFWPFSSWQLFCKLILLLFKPNFVTIRLSLYMRCSILKFLRLSHWA